MVKIENNSLEYKTIFFLILIVYIQIILFEAIYMQYFLSQITK